MATGVAIIVFLLVVVPLGYWIVRGVTGGFRKQH